jgi:uncharacterized protein YbjT (DUF2867 family)
MHCRLDKKAFFLFILTANMSASNERVFVIGASGSIGSGVVRGLVKHGVHTTAYVRDENKAKNLFRDELKSSYLKLVVGTYSSVDVYTKAIQGHTRLFLLVNDDPNKPAALHQIEEKFGKIAFEQGVRQIVDLSTFSVSTEGKKGVAGYSHATAEEKLLALADENPEQRSLVILRPGAFMSNHFWGDIHHVKHSNKLRSCGLPSSTVAWIDTKGKEIFNLNEQILYVYLYLLVDVSDCAVVVLTESVEKHDRNIYDMCGESLSHEERAAVFSKVLGRSITYEQQSIEEFYKALIGIGGSHSMVYYMLQHFTKTKNGIHTPQLAIILNRPLRTLEEWLRENIQAFQ